ncbi:MAG: DUF2304 family protein [Candidatus Woesearchaeota archaeon]
MIEAISIIIILFALFALSRAYLRFKERKISNWSFALWFIIWIAVITVVLIPETTSQISKFFGIERGVDLLVYASIIIIFYLIFRLYIKIDQTEQNLTKVVRKVSKEE